MGCFAVSFVPVGTIASIYNCCSFAIVDSFALKAEEDLA